MRSILISMYLHSPIFSLFGTVMKVSMEYTFHKIHGLAYPPCTLQQEKSPYSLTRRLPLVMLNRFSKHHYHVNCSCCAAANLVGQTGGLSGNMVSAICTTHQRSIGLSVCSLLPLNLCNYEDRIIYLLIYIILSSKGQ